MANTETTKKITKYLQYLSAVILTIGSIFRIVIPWVKAEPIYLDGNDGWVIFGCLALALVSEAVKRFLNRKTDKL